MNVLSCRHYTSGARIPGGVWQMNLTGGISVADAAELTMPPRNTKPTTAELAHQETAESGDPERVIIENVNVPDATTRVDATWYNPMIPQWLNNQTVRRQALCPFRKSDAYQNLFPHFFGCTPVDQPAPVCLRSYRRARIADDQRRCNRTFHYTGLVQHRHDRRAHR